MADHPVRAVTLVKDVHNLLDLTRCLSRLICFCISDEAKVVDGADGYAQVSAVLFHKTVSRPNTLFRHGVFLVPNIEGGYDRHFLVRLGRVFGDYQDPVTAFKRFSIRLCQPARIINNS